MAAWKVSGRWACVISAYQLLKEQTDPGVQLRALLHGWESVSFYTRFASSAVYLSAFHDALFQARREADVAVARKVLAKSERADGAPQQPCEATVQTVEFMAGYHVRGFLRNHGRPTQDGLRACLTR